jgi:hypothetical protein
VKRGAVVGLVVVVVVVEEAVAVGEGEDPMTS